MQGIDISNWQKNINLPAVIRSNKIEFVIAKATEGVSFTDKYFNNFMNTALSLNKKIGLYHFARPELNGAKAEARYFYDNVKKFTGKAVFILDWESSGKSNTAWALEWLKEFERLSGVKALIYMSESVVNSYDWEDVVAGDYGLWVAKYKDNNPVYDYNTTGRSRPFVKFWPFFAMWQFTSTGRLTGYSGNLDLNIFYGNASIWDKYAKSSKYLEGWQKIGIYWYYYKDGKPLSGFQWLKWSKGAHDGKDLFYFDKSGKMLDNAEKNITIKADRNGVIRNDS